MARISFDKFQKDFAKNSKRIIKELEKSMPDVGDQMIATIRKRTRAGYGLSKNKAIKNRLLKLSDSYKSARRRMNLSSEARWNKSNLTRTGSMLNNLDKDVGRSSVRVAPAGNDRDGVSNAEKGGWAHEQGRPFLFLSRPEIRRLSRFIKEKYLDRIIKKLY